jgi:hypothetical protein
MVMARVIDRLGNYLDMDEPCVDLTKYQRGWCALCERPLGIFWGIGKEYEIVCEPCNRDETESDYGGDNL